MSKPSKPSGKPSPDRHHLKFNKDVLPDFKRRQDAWEVDEGGRRGAQSASDIETDSILKWVGVGIMMLMIAAVIGITLHRGGGGKDDEGPKGLTPAQILDQERDAVREIVRDYMATGSIAERLRLVRRVEAVGPLMEKFYAEYDLYPLKVWSYEQVEPVSVDGVPFWRVVINTPEGREELRVEQLQRGFKVDWETHVGLNPMRPDDYLRKKPEGELDFRVFVSPDDYYNGVFSDQDKYLVAKLEFANSGAILFGYIERNSPGFSEFLELVDGGAAVPMILTLEWPGGARGADAQLPQVHIRRMVAGRWLILD